MIPNEIGEGNQVFAFEIHSPTVRLPVFPPIVQPCSSIQQGVTMHWVQPIYMAGDLSATLVMVDGITNQVTLNVVARGWSQDKVQVLRGNETMMGLTQNLVVEGLALWTVSLVTRNWSRVRYTFKLDDVL